MLFIYINPLITKVFSPNFHHLKLSLSHVIHRLKLTSNIISFRLSIDAKEKYQQF